MERRRPEAGEVYRHFKGKEYRILHIAVSTDTGEEMVVFETMEGEHKVYTSLVETFLSPLDTARFPYVEQKYRFELCRGGDGEAGIGSQRHGNVTALILEFLDLDEDEEKIRFLREHRGEIDSRFLTAAAESMEFAENADSVEERYGDLLRYLRTRMRYEGRRLR